MIKYLYVSTVPLNDQIFVYTTHKSANKYTPYSIIGATFNDTNRTITISGTTALSGLTADVSISSVSDSQALIYNSSANNWINQQIDHTTLSNIGTNSHTQNR